MRIIAVILDVRVHCSIETDSQTEKWPEKWNKFNHQAGRIRWTWPGRDNKDQFNVIISIGQHLMSSFFCVNLSTFVCRFDRLF